MKRDLSIDVTKFVAIFLVCFYHLNWIFTEGLELAEFSNYDFLREGILIFTAMAVPLFFLVNGYLVLDKEFNYKKTFKNISNIVIQYYFFLCITLIVVLRVFELNFSDVFYTKNIISMLFFYQPSGLYLNYLWFIPSFIAITLISPAFKPLFSKWDNDSKKYIVSIIFIGIITVFLPKDLYALSMIFPKLKGIDMSSLISTFPFSLRVGNFIVYFLIGGLLKKRKGCSAIKNYLLVFIFISSTFLNWIYWYFISTSTGSSYDIVFSSYNMIPTLFMTISFFLLTQNIFKEINIDQSIQKVIIFISKNTLNIYFLHRIIDILLFTRLKSIILVRGILANSIKTIIMLGLSSIIILFLKKFKITRWTMR